MTMPIAVRRVVALPAPGTAGPSTQTSDFAPATLSAVDAGRAANLLQQLVFAFTDLYLTAKQAHWNVIGPAFIGVHAEILDPLASIASSAADSCAERIATLGGTPIGTAGAVASGRGVPEYQLKRADTQTHLRAIDQVVANVGEKLRKCIAYLGECDVVSQNMALGLAETLEKMQWFIRAHIETPNGEIPLGS